MYEAWENMKLLLMVSGGAILWIVMVLVAVGLVLAAAIIITLTVKELKAQHKRNKGGFSASRMPDNADKFALFDGKIDILHGGNAKRGSLAVDIG